jgi:hypothetical protein
MAKTIDLYVDEYKIKPRGKKIKIKVKKGKPKRKPKKPTSTDSQGRSTNPYSDGCSGVADW